MKLLLILTLTATALAQVPDHALIPGDPAPAALQTLRDRYRPILIFTPSEDVPSFQTQVNLLAAHAAELAERDVVFIAIPYRANSQPFQVAGPMRQVSLTPLGESEARQQFHVAHNSFTVIQLGKDGGEKLRDHVPIRFERLRDLIDSMPMRQQEMKGRSQNR
jgi:hypothetical protein